MKQLLIIPICLFFASLAGAQTIPQSISKPITSKASTKMEVKGARANKEVNKARNKNWKNKYDAVSDFRDGLYMVTLKNKNGFTDKNGTVVIPLIYNSVDWFQNTIRVRIKSEWFYIDKNGNRLPDDNHSY